MNILVLISSEDAFNQAGVRIRYQRLIEHFSSHGGSLSLRAITDIEVPSDVVDKYDVILISKCYTVRSLIIAQAAHAAGKLVGVDMFDDYFSQLDDPRFSRLRYWLKQLKSYCGFVLCSTEAISDVSKKFFIDLPHHVLNDPFDYFDELKIARLFEEKKSFAVASKFIKLAWFGIGDNPNFSVGLSDLVAFGDELSVFIDNGFQVNLHILTNERALTVENLAALKRLDVPYELSLWTEKKESELLESSLLAFLPVNAQPFSRVKSMNRCVTALSRGAQVLSCGFPLYEKLEAFIYASATDFVVDLLNGELRCNAETIDFLSNQLTKLASPERESEAFYSFLSRLQARQSASLIETCSRERVAVVLHGLESSGHEHKYIKKINGYSVSTPFCTARLNFDIRFQWLGDSSDIEVFVSKKILKRVCPDYFSASPVHVKIIDTDYVRLDSRTIWPDGFSASFALARWGGRSGVSLSYPYVIDFLKQAVSKLLPNCACFVSESSKLPWLLPNN